MATSYILWTRGPTLFYSLGFWGISNCKCLQYFFSVQKLCRTLLCKTDNQQRPSIEHRELCSRLCGSLDGRGIWGRMDTCIGMAESLHCSPEIITTLLIGYAPVQNRVSPAAQIVKNLPAMQETLVKTLGKEDPLEKGMANHSSILAWKIPWTEETNGVTKSWIWLSN